MEIFGLHEYIRDVTRRLAKLGAFAVAPDYYFRKGDLTKITEMPALFPIVNAKTDAELFADLDATVAWAKSQGGDTNRLGIMGFCRGGRTVWRLLDPQSEPQGRRRLLWQPRRSAHRSDAGEQPSTPPPQVKEPVLGLYGAEDQGITADHVDQMKAALQKAGKTADSRSIPAPPRLPRRLPSELSQGSGRGRLEADDRLVQEVQRPVLNGRRPADRVRDTNAADRRRHRPQKETARGSRPAPFP